MKKNHFLYFVTTQLFILLFSYTSSANTLTVERQNTDFFGENSRWSIDASTRLTHNSDKNTTAFMHVLGLDIHKVFSGARHDIGTLTFQPYIVKLNNVKKAPFIFDDGNDTELTWRIANFNYTGLNQGKFNIRIGHFEVPFGLEYQIDTNGTLRQLTTADRGIKADWGVSVNGVLPHLEYEIALTRGSGNELKSTGNPHIFSGRIGTLSNKNLVTGLSWFTGDVLGGSGVTNRQKIGVDVSYYYYQWQFMIESSMGQTAGNDTINTFVEVLWKNPNEKISTYLQIGAQSSEINYKVSDSKSSTSYWLAGVQWLSHNGFDISAQYKHKLKDTPTIEIDPILSMQLRYRM